MPSASRALLLGLLIVMPAFAGCNVKDWYDQVGTVRIQLKALDGAPTKMNEFRSIKVALYGVTLRQADAVNPLHFSWEEPRIVDLVEQAREGEEIGITEFRSNLRAIESVRVKVVVIEAIDAAGNNMQVCRRGEAVERFPCFFQYEDDSLYYDKPFSPPRGGTVVVHFPLAIKYAVQGRASQYFLFADPSLVELENKR